MQDGAKEVSQLVRVGRKLYLGARRPVLLEVGEKTGGGWLLISQYSGPRQHRRQALGQFGLGL